MVSNAFRYYSGAALATGFLLLLASSCGSKSSTVAMPVSSKTDTAAASGTQQDAGGLSGSGSGAGACNSKADCAPAASDVSANFAPSGALLGFVGEPVDWEFHGVDRNTANADQQSSQRKIMVLLNKVPEGSKINPAPGSGSLSADTKINWTPTQEEQGTMDIILRDYDRCGKNESADYCNAYAFHDPYDTKMKGVAWQIVDKSKLQAAINTQGTDAAAGAATNAGTTANVVKVANPNCGPAATNVTAAATNAIIPLFTGLLSGGGANILTSLGPKLLSGGLTGGSSAPSTPTQCQ